MQQYSPKQADVLLNADARWNLLVGAASSGKTYVSYDLLLKRMRRQPPGPALLIGRTQQTLERNVLAPMRERFGDYYVSRIRSDDGSVYLFGRKCYAVGANDEQAQKKIQGMSIVYAYGDEFPTWPESFMNMLKSRLRIPGAKFDGTGNPEGPYHWAKVNMIDKATELGMKVWHFVLDDNPFNDPAFVADLKAQYAGTVWYQRLILGLWVQAQGAIYDMFNENIHVVDSLPSWPVHTYLVPIDYATGNPTAFLMLAVVTDPKERLTKVYVVDEYYWDSRARGRQKTDAEYSADLKQFIARIAPTIYVDPSAASFKAQLRKDNVHNVKDADNSVLDGIRLVASFLVNRRLFFLRGKTPNLLREIGGYVWDAAAQKKGEDKPVKENDHALDALRYGIYTHFKRDGLATTPVAKHPAW